MVAQPTPPSVRARNQVTWRRRLYATRGSPGVWIVGADTTVKLQPVSVSAYTDSGAVVTDGLAGGEQIVAAGVNLLTVGEKVRVAPQANGK